MSHIQLSSLLARTLFVPLSPTKGWALTLLLLLALFSLALPWGSVCFGGLAVIHFTWAFSEGLLAYCQGASDSLPHPSPGREVEASGFGIEVWTLLQAMSLPRCMESSPEPGQRLSVSTFKGCNSVLNAFSF